MEDHAEVKDKCIGLETKLDEIASEIRNLPFNYKLVEKYSNIDENVHEIYDWHEKNKIILENYMKEKSIVDEKLRDLEKSTRFLNHETQNIKMTPTSMPLKRHGGSCSQLLNN
jgi:septation ring formation regulator EzrA